MYAQNVGISPDGTAPDASAGLDVNFPDRGMLIPRVNLVSTTSSSPVETPAVSLLVYNTATVNDITPGYYFWNGTVWKRLNPAVDGSGTVNYLTKWNSAGTLGNSQVFDNGTNVGIGTAAPGARLEVAGRISQTTLGKSVFIGEGAGAADDLTDNYNSFVGYKAGAANTSGTMNSAFGSYSLYTNATGSENTATGFYALIYSTGSLNTANGSSALFLNSTGSNNTATGAGALRNNTTGSQNTATGYNSLYYSNGNNNTAYGCMSMNSTSGGWYNTAVGSMSMYTNTNGSNNTTLGYYADVQSNMLQNATAIGYRAAVGASNCLVLGSIYGVNGASQSVNVGIGTTTPTERLHVVGSVKIADGTQGIKKVLTSDANGLASWKATELDELVLTQPAGCFQVSGSAGTGSGPWNVVVSGNYAYLVNRYSKTMFIYNISNPASPSQVGSVSTGSDPKGIAVSGNYAYITNSVSSTLTIYNVNNPATPVQVGSVSTGSLPASVAVSGNFAYVVNMVSNTLTIYNVSNPASPYLVGSAATGSEPACVAVSGNYAYVVNCTGNSLLVYNVSNPTSPSLVGSVVTGSYPNWVTISGNYAYVVNSSSNTMTIYNVSNPASPTQVGSAGTGSYPTSVAVSGNIACVTNYNSDAITIFDIRNPASPVTVNSVSTGSKPICAAILNTNTYVLNHVSNTMQVIQVKCPQINIEVQNDQVILNNPTWITNNNNISNVNTGNVGIGTSSPSAKLDVAGTVKIADGSQGMDKVLTSDANGLASWQTPTSAGSWSLTGNAGTINGTNFIGTTDNRGLDFRTNNILRMRISTYGAMETYNNGESVFIGEGTGSSDDLSSNKNVFIGHMSGKNTISGNLNIAIGPNSMFANTEGYQNNAIGAASLVSNIDGNNNTAGGSSSLFHNTSGSNNTAYGFATLMSNITGEFNTAIGSLADVASDTLVNSSAIGAYAQVGADNSLVLGSIIDVNNAPATVNVGIGTTTPSARLHVVGNVKIADGTEGAGKVLTSDADGLASWQSLSIPPAGWSLTGNAGTIAGTNFIGTTDSVDFDIRTNNSLKVRITTRGVIEPQNTGNSVLIGLGAGTNDDLTNNQNAFIGTGAGYTNITGFYNTALGTNAMSANSSGIINTAVGCYALAMNSTGNYNTAGGANALYHNSNGNNNVSTGNNSLWNNTTGSGNTANGASSLYANTTGSFNTAIGDSSDVASGSLTNATAIGSKALVGASNSLVLGSINGVNGATASVNVGIGTTTPAKRLDVSGELQTTGTGNNYFAGNVGIGAASPATKLDVNGTIKMPNLLFYPPTGDPSPTITARTVPTGQGNSTEKTELIIFHGNDNTGGSGVDQITLRAPALSFQTYNNTGVNDIDNVLGYNVRMYVNSIGNVGIGTTSPGAKLDVAGRIWQTGTGESVFVGESAGAADDLTTNQNTFVGYYAGLSNTTAAAGTAIGHEALRLNTTGYYNTAIGYSALYNNTTGASNTGLGDHADVSSGALTNATAIGSHADVNASNKIRLGNTSVTAIEGQVAYTYPSDGRFKSNVKEDVPGLAFINKLRPVTYNFDKNYFSRHIGEKQDDPAYLSLLEEQSKEIKTGFIAQEVEQVAAELGYHFDGLHVADKDNPYDNYSLAYSQFTVPLVKAVQELSAQLNTTLAKVDELEKENMVFRSENAVLSGKIDSMQAQIEEIRQYLETKAEE